MAFSHGKDAILKVDTAAGVLTDISPYITGVTLSREQDTAEVSVLGADDKQYMAGMRGATISCDGRFDPTFDALVEGLLAANSITDFEYYPVGLPIGPTKPKYAGTMIVTSNEIGTSIDDSASDSVEFMVTGAVVRTTA
jgi:predicted secreted protein